MPPVVLMTDLAMPEMSGSQLAAEVRRRWPFFRIIFATAFSDDKRLSGETVVRKPYSVAELHAAITRVLESR